MQANWTATKSIENRGLVTFYFLAYGVSWALWSPLIALPQWADRLGFLVILGAYGPWIAGMMTTFLFEGSTGLRRWLKAVFRWRIPFRWYLLGALLLPLGMSLLQISLYLLTGGEVELSTNPPWYWVFAAYPVNLLLVPFSSGMEEPGWQGYAFPSLAKRFQPFSAAIVLGSLWAVWHAPLYFTTAWEGAEPFPLMVAYTIPLSMILFWLTRRASGSVLPAILLHWSTNYFGGLLLSQAVFTEPLSQNFTLYKTLVYWVFALVLLAWTKGRLGAESRSKTE